MKRVLSLFLVIAIVTTMSVSVFATDHDKSLSSIAESTIQITQTNQESGAVILTYCNLKDFVRNVHEELPDVVDYDIAKFILNYTGQCSDGMPESEVILMLDYDNISTSTQYIKVTEEGSAVEISPEEFLIAPVDVWISNDGYMQLTTNVSHVSTSGSNKYFSVWTTAKWLKYPAIAIEDVLVLGTNGTFDSNCSEYGYVYQTFRCTSGCTDRTYRNRYVSKTNTVYEDLEMEYKGYTPYLRFVPIAPRCDYCDGGSRDYSFTAFIRYGVITSSTCNVEAAYCHQTIGITGVDVSIDSMGSPSFSFGLGCVGTDYIARAVTLS